MFSASSTLSLLAFAAGALAIRNSIYVIHEVESPGLGLDGLTPIGLQRAQTCIPNVFKNKGIGKIISCKVDPATGVCWNAVSTVQPLANALNLTIDTSCDTGEEAEDDCVANLIETFAATSTRAILLAWDAAEEETLFENLDIELPESEDDDGGSIYHHDEYVTIRNDVFIGFASQDCPNIDGQAPGTGIFARVPAPHVDTKASNDNAPAAESAPTRKRRNVQKRQPRKKRAISRIYG